jgi:hypothetical protein
MTREEKCKLAIERGFTYNPETGEVLYRNEKKYIYNHFGYLKIYMFLEDKKRIQLKSHQFAWYWVNKECVEEIDHINGIRNDNRICNLRSVTRQQNQWNRKTAKGFYKDFYKDRIYYVAQIYINTKHINLGRYKTEQEARNAYLEAKQKYHVI